MHCLVIDDNEKTRNVLVDLLRDTVGVLTVEAMLHPYLIRGLLERQQVDTVFIRVRLWDYSLFENCTRLPKIVFLCGGKDKLTDKTGTAVRFRMREPLRPWGIELLVKKLKAEEAETNADYFFVRYEGRFHRVYFKDIILIERMRGSYVLLCFGNQQWLVPGSLQDWLKRLPPDRFIRVSDTLVLSVEEVYRIRNNQYQFQGRTIRLTYRFAAAAKKDLAQMSDTVYGI